MLGPALFPSAVIAPPGKDGIAGTGRLQLALLKVALILGVKVKAGAEHALKASRTPGEPGMLAGLGKFDVLLFAPSFRPDLLQAITSEAGGSMIGQLEMQTDQLGGTAGNSAIAVVAHFEASDEGKAPDANADAKAFQTAAKPTDWSGHVSPECKKQDAELRAQDVCIQNYVVYPLVGPKLRCPVDVLDGQCRLDVAPPLERAIGIPSTYYYVFTLDTKELVKDDLRLLKTLIKDGAAEAPEEAKRSCKALIQWAKKMPPGWELGKDDGGRRVYRNVATQETTRVRPSHLDTEALGELVRKVARYFTTQYIGKQGSNRGHTITRALPDCCRLLSEIQPDGPIEQSKTLDIFDFSGQRTMRADSAACVVSEIYGKPRARGGLLVLPIGDALQVSDSSELEGYLSTRTHSLLIEGFLSTPASYSHFLLPLPLCSGRSHSGLRGSALAVG